MDADPVSALKQARALAGDLDVRIGGGVSAVRQFLEADLIDHMHIVLVPIVLGRGERLWDGPEGLEQGFDIQATPSPSGALRLIFTRRRPGRPTWERPPVDDRLTGQSDQLNFHEGRGSMPDASSLQAADRLVP